jgi:hypothetical protein
MDNNNEQAGGETSEVETNDAVLEKLGASPLTPAQEANELMQEKIAERAQIADKFSPAYKRLNREIANLAYTAAEGELSASEQAAKDGLRARRDKIEQAQAGLARDFEDEISKLEKLGFERPDRPEELAQYQIDSLRMQRLNAEGNYETLTPMLAKEMRELGQPPKIMDLFNAFANTEGLDPALRHDIVEQLLKLNYKARKTNYEARRMPTYEEAQAQAQINAALERGKAEAAEQDRIISQFNENT